jgi:putative transposase
MPNYRRAFLPGGTYFFTVATEGRAPILDHPSARSALGDAIRRCRARWPFQVDAIVLLPDHLLTIWSLPKDDTAYPIRWAWIKREFTLAWLAAGGAERATTASRQSNRRRGVWQRRYWEHVVRDEGELERLGDYIHYNPVKHGHVACPSDWPYSSFAKWVERGHYPPDWGCSSLGPLCFDDVVTTAIE